jgi:hypothetical protein
MHFKAVIPPEYYDFLLIFDKAKTNVLLFHRLYDHKIPLKPIFILLFGPLSSMSYNELLALRNYLDKNLTKGFIKQ